MNRRNLLPPTVEANLDARLAPFVSPGGCHALEDIDVEASRAVAPQDDNRHRHRLMRDIKLLFAALGAGGSAVPMGDNGHATRQLVSLAACLRDP